MHVLWCITGQAWTSLVYCSLSCCIVNTVFWMQNMFLSIRIQVLTENHLPISSVTSTIARWLSLPPAMDCLRNKAAALSFMFPSAKAKTMTKKGWWWGISINGCCNSHYQLRTAFHNIEPNSWDSVWIVVDKELGIPAAHMIFMHKIIDSISQKSSCKRERPLAETLKTQHQLLWANEIPNIIWQSYFYSYLLSTSIKNFKWGHIPFY